MNLNSHDCSSHWFKPRDRKFWITCLVPELIRNWKKDIYYVCGCDREYEIPRYFKFSNLLFKILNFEKRNYIFNNNNNNKKKEYLWRKWALMFGEWNSTTYGPSPKVEITSTTHHHSPLLLSTIPLIMPQQQIKSFNNVPKCSKKKNRTKILEQYGIYIVYMDTVL